VVPGMERYVRSWWKYYGGAGGHCSRCEEREAMKVKALKNNIGKTDCDDCAFEGRREREQPCSECTVIWFGEKQENWTPIGVAQVRKECE